MSFWNYASDAQSSLLSHSRLMQVLEVETVDNGSDDQAVVRYQYMLRTAPPDIIERAHVEAFAQLIPEQRDLVLREFAAQLPMYERHYLRSDDCEADPHTLAQLATRAEMRYPGSIERMTVRIPGGSSADMPDGMFGATILEDLAAGFVGSAVARQFFAGWDAEPPFGAQLAPIFDGEFFGTLEELEDIEPDFEGGIDGFGGVDLNVNGVC